MLDSWLPKFWLLMLPIVPIYIVLAEAVSFCHAFRPTSICKVRSKVAVENLHLVEEVPDFSDFRCRVDSPLFHCTSSHHVLLINLSLDRYHEEVKRQIIPPFSKLFNCMQSYSLLLMTLLSVQSQYTAPPPP